MAIVRSGAAQEFDRLTLEFEQNPNEIMSEVGLALSQFRDPDTYIAYSRLADLLEVAAAKCQEPLFGILLGQRQSLLGLGDIVVLVSQADTLGDALAHVNDYLYLHCSGIRLELNQQNNWVELSLKLEVDNTIGTDQLLQMSVIQLARIVSNMLNIESGSLGLYLTQSINTEDLNTRVESISHIQFASKFDGIMINASLLSRKIHHNKDALERHFREHLAYLKKRYPNNLNDQTKDMIRRLLVTGECSVELVARALDLHPRILQARLKENGVTYSHILQKVRQNLAEKQLKEVNNSITDIALQLGYAEIAVFSRHFRRWTGFTPTQWRRLQQL